MRVKNPRNYISAFSIVIFQYFMLERLNIILKFIVANRKVTFCNEYIRNSTIIFKFKL